MSPIDFVGWIVVHCSGDDPRSSIGVKELRRRQMQQGAADVGYHYIIRRDGTIEKGRPAQYAGNHAPGYDKHSLAICMIGGRKARSTKAQNNFTPEQFESLWELACELLTWHPDAEFVGHRDLPGQAVIAGACPSFDVIGWFAERIDAAHTIQVQDDDASSIRGSRPDDKE